MIMTMKDIDATVQPSETTPVTLLYTKRNAADILQREIFTFPILLLLPFLTNIS